METDENVSPSESGESLNGAGAASIAVDGKGLRRRNVTFSKPDVATTEGGGQKITNGILSESNAPPILNGIIRIDNLVSDSNDTDAEEIEETTSDLVNGKDIEEPGFVESIENEEDKDNNEDDPVPPGSSTDARRDSVDSSATTCSNNNNNGMFDEMDMDVDEGDFGEEGEEGEGEDGDFYDDYEYDPYSHEWVPKIKPPESDEDSEAALLVSKESRHQSLSTIAHALLESARTNNEASIKERDQRHFGEGVEKELSFFDELLLCCGGCRKLCKIEEMPPHLQFNRYVHTGYRHLQDAWGCVLSLFYIHNETLNIATHLAPIIYVLVYWQTMFPWDDIKGNVFLNVLGWSHIIASIAPWIGSVFYHMMMSHNSGPDFYQFLLQIDMFGIWITECFGALTNLSAATWCLSESVKNWIVGIYGLAAVFGLQKALTAWTPVARRMCFAPVFIARILGVILRLSKWGGGDPSILLHVFLQDIISVTGGIVGVVRIPEKWFPGKLDIFLNSHHIMHIMVVIAVIHMNLATNGDIRWIINNYSGEQCPAN